MSASCLLTVCYSPPTGTLQDNVLGFIHVFSGLHDWSLLCAVVCLSVCVWVRFMLGKGDGWCGSTLLSQGWLCVFVCPINYLNPGTIKGRNLLSAPSIRRPGVCRPGLLPGSKSSAACSQIEITHTLDIKHTPWSAQRAALHAARERSHTAWILHTHPGQDNEHLVLNIYIGCFS